MTPWHTQSISQTTAASRWVTTRMRIDGAIDVKLWQRSAEGDVRFLVPSDILRGAGNYPLRDAANYDLFWGPDEWARGVPADVAAELLRQLFRHG